jgi:GNAT superfamily N-acetyltransferase
MALYPPVAFGGRPLRKQNVMFAISTASVRPFLSLSLHARIFSGQTAIASTRGLFYRGANYHSARRVMFVPIDAPLPFQLREASMDDFAFAETLTRTNMGGYYHRHHLVWRSDLFLGSWRESENFILEMGREPIGVLRVTVEGDSLHIRDVQIADGHRRRGAGTYLLDISHQWARERGLRELQLRVFVDNPAARLYQRMGYKLTGPRLAQLGAIRHLARRV